MTTSHRVRFGALSLAGAAAVGALIGLAPTASAAPTASLTCSANRPTFGCFLTRSTPSTVRWYVNGSYRAQWDNLNAVSGACGGFSVQVSAVVTDATGSTTRTELLSCPPR